MLQKMELGIKFRGCKKRGVFGEGDLSVLAVQHIRRMRGGAQGQLMLGADGNMYVVKFQNNPQHLRVLANEYLAAKMAQAAGLTTPDVAVIEVSNWLVEHTPELEMDYGKRRERCKPGLQFGSRFVGGEGVLTALDYMPEEQMTAVRNREEFAGILALDKWTGNANGRQAVFVRRRREKGYKAVFIDYGYCFHAGDWCFEDLPLRGVYYRNDVYREITGWKSFAPWLERLEGMDEAVVWKAANEIPGAWYGDDVSAMEELVESFLVRRKRIRELIEQFRLSARNPFPQWGLSAAMNEEAERRNACWNMVPQRVM